MVRATILTFIQVNLGWRYHLLNKFNMENARTNHKNRKKNSRQLDQTLHLGVEPSLRAY